MLKLWNGTSRFETVYICPQGQAAWSDEIDTCADALYLPLAGKSPSDILQSMVGAG